MMSKGISSLIILKFLFLLVPFMLSYSIPISILTSVLLVFSRLSADNEVTAIRASGVHLKKVMVPVIVCSLVLSGICYFINSYWRPNSIFNGRKLLLEVGMQEPLMKMESGRFNEIFPGYLVYIAQKHGKIFKQVVVYKFEQEDLRTVITAESGQFAFGSKKDQNVVNLNLFNGVIEDIPINGQETGKLNRMQFGTYTIDFNVTEQIKDLSKITKKEREMTNPELSKRVNELQKKIKQQAQYPLVQQLEQEISSIKTRIHNRVALAVSCFMFILVGIPLGISVHRSETSIGAGISLILMSVYYFLTTLGEAFQYKINMHPWVLMWIPNIFLLVIGTRLVYKLFQK